MTNLCAELAIYSLVVTQWTGLTLNNKEAGVVVTNHEARVSFEGRTNALPLKTELSEVAVWRDRPDLPVLVFTNTIRSWPLIPWPYPNYTNYYVPPPVK